MNHEDYSDIAIDIVYNTFLRFMRYVNIDVINSGKQITSLLNLVLQSNLTNEYQHAKKIRRYFENHKASYEDALDEPDSIKYYGYEIDDDIDKIDDKQKLIYLVEYITTELPYEYELHNQLTEMMNGKRKELSDYSRKIIDKWMSDNNMSSIQVMNNAIANHEEFTNDLFRGLTF